MPAPEGHIAPDDFVAAIEAAQKSIRPRQQGIPVHVLLHTQEYRFYPF
jgi:hypothetical protein